MPITQDRLGTILAAAMDYHDAFARLQALSKVLTREVQESRSTADSAYMTLAEAIRTGNTLRAPLFSSGVLLSEKDRYERTIRVNEKKKLKKQIQRRDMGKPLRPDGTGTLPPAGPRARPLTPVSMDPSLREDPDADGMWFDDSEPTGAPPIPKPSKYIPRPLAPAEKDTLDGDVERLARIYLPKDGDLE